MVFVPPVVMIPATSSRYFAAAMSARAESFTVDGAWPSAQLIDGSALALLLAVLDHLKKLISQPRNVNGPFWGAARTVGVDGCDVAQRSLVLAAGRARLRWMKSVSVPVKRCFLAYS